MFLKLPLASRHLSWCGPCSALFFGPAWYFLNPTTQGCPWSFYKIHNLLRKTSFRGLERPGLATLISGIPLNNVTIPVHTAQTNPAIERALELVRSISKVQIQNPDLNSGTMVQTPSRCTRPARERFKPRQQSALNGTPQTCSGPFLKCGGGVRNPGPDSGLNFQKVPNPLESGVHTSPGVGFGGCRPT